MRCVPSHKSKIAVKALMRAGAFPYLRTEGSAVTSPPALTTARGYAQWLTTA